MNKYMKKLNLRLTALMAAMMMTMTCFAKTQDWGGRVILMIWSFMKDAGQYLKNGSK